MRFVAAALLCVGIFCLGLPLEAANVHIGTGRALLGSSVPTSLLPNQVPGLQLWLSADVNTFTDSGCSAPATNGQGVQCWGDRSGKGNNATQATGADQPTLATAVQNGLSGITFNGSSDIFSSSYLGNPGTCIAAYLAKAVTTSDPTLELALLWANNGTGAASFALRVGTSGTGAGPFTQASYAIENTSSAVFSTALSAQFNVPDIIGFRGGGTAAALAYRWNIPSQAAGDLTGTQNAIAAAAIGGDLGSATRFNGYIYEIACYSGSITTLQYSQVVAYLQNKWGINQPTGNYYLTGMESLGGSSVFSHFSLYMLRSSDGVHWKWVPSNIVPNTGNLTTSNSIQDPALLLAASSPHTGGLDWLAVSNYPNNGFPSSNSWDLYSSPAGTNNFAFVQHIDASAFTGSTVGSSAVANPSWFIDTDGSIHVVVAALSASSGNHAVLEFHPTTQGNMAGPWSAPSSNINPVSQPFNLNGPTVYNVSGIYYQFYTNGGSSIINYATSTTNFSGYSVVQAGDFGGWSAGLGNHSIEQAGFLNVSGTIYGYGYDFTAPKAFYSQLTGTFPTGTWGTPTAITTNIQNGGVIQDGIYTRAAGSP